MLQLTTVGAPGGPFLQWLAPSAVTFTVVNVAGGPPATDNPEGSIASARSTATNDTSSRLIPNPTLSISMPRVPRSERRPPPAVGAGQRNLSGVSGRQ